MKLDQRIKAACWGALLAPLMCSCANGPDREKTWGPVPPRDEVRVIFQICLPDLTTSFEDVEIELEGIPPAKTMREERAANGLREVGPIRSTTPSTEPQIDSDRVVVRRWISGTGARQLKAPYLKYGEVLNRNGIFSASSGAISLWNTSQGGQPVFEKEGHRPNHTIAIDLSMEVDENSSTYWYKLPEEIPSDRFSSWQDPISQESLLDGRKTRFNLVNGRNIQLRQVVGNAPKIRYRLMQAEEYYDQYRFWMRAQKAVGERFYRGVNGEERLGRHFVPQLLEPIPRC